VHSITDLVHKVIAKGCQRGCQDVRRILTRSLFKGLLLLRVDAVVKRVHSSRNAFFELLLIMTSPGLGVFCYKVLLSQRGEREVEVEVIDFFSGAESALNFKDGPAPLSKEKCNFEPRSFVAKCTLYEKLLLLNREIRVESHDAVDGVEGGLLPLEVQVPRQVGEINFIQMFLNELVAIRVQVNDVRPMCCDEVDIVSVCDKIRSNLTSQLVSVAHRLEELIEFGS
jgi:hypothetical protein